MFRFEFKCMSDCFMLFPCVQCRFITILVLHMLPPIDNAPHNTGEFIAFLRHAGLIEAKEQPRFTALTGGVSSDIWKVETASQTLCVKRALGNSRSLTTGTRPLNAMPMKLPGCNTPPPSFLVARRKFSPIHLTKACSPWIISTHPHADCGKMISGKA